MMGINMEPITLLVAALATGRLTRLITRDRIMHAPRRWLLSKLEPEGLAAYLLVCDWCASVYVGAGMALLLWAGPAWVLWPLYALAFSYVAGWLASKEDE